MISSIKFFHQDVKWLGGKHDGYPLASFQDYPMARNAHTHTGAATAFHVAQYQSHLIFGLLEAAIEQKISENDLLQQIPTGEVVLSSHNIPLILRQWRERIQDLRKSDMEAHNQWFRRAQVALEQARAILMLEIRSPGNSPFINANCSKDDIAGILYGITALGETLTLSKAEFQIPSKGIDWSFLNGRFIPYENDMVSRGWCPSTARFIGQEMCRLGYASTCKPLFRQGAGGQHDKCTRKVPCSVNSIVLEDYSIRHVVESCRCDYSKPSLPAISDILSGFQVPIVTVEGSALACIKATDGPYVAISHVWADGLGSTTEVGLPICQLQRLSNMAKKLVPGGAFWMDGLCIPGQEDLRRQAIGLMGTTYRDATAVLVIDDGIRTCSFDALEEERLLRVLTSVWMQRMWTLQEAMLARKLIFEFSDKLVALEDLIPSRENLWDAVKTQLAAEVFRLSKHQLYSPHDRTAFNIGDVARSLQWRSTSKAEDETLAISSLLNVDAMELVALPPGKRMMTLLLRVRQLPLNILFLSGPKLEEPGFKWAPRSLMNREGSQLRTMGYNAVCTAKGLVAEYLCIYFGEATFDRGERWFLQNASTGDFYSVIDIGAETGALNPLIKGYTCSGILFEAQPMALEIGAAALIKSLQDTQETESEQVGRNDINKLGARRILDVLGTGKMKVCLA
ncbi:hypothetical protein BDZ94DRAFT_1235800 [Collybia nuda]|uniref:Heterokaryon incompatibility domain-containing protein n=1 Tax=Collybia nuda TaxID=64659 RepID=A0A9P5Y7Y6_9AGAR|nr:hypothetical protein BDZ94DRAFT_1235800 [Collybia nuda]